MLSKKYDAKTSESKWSEFWKFESIFKYDGGKTSVVYSIDTPPPTVSGKLHIGHIFSYTQAEIIARYKRMQGFNVYYPFGFDDNGLPTERLVEKEQKIKAKDLSRSDFNALCIKTINTYEEEFKELWTSLGFSCDWDLCYETISPLSQRISQRSFIELLKQGKAYREESPVLYCTNCETSIAQAELESTNKNTLFNYIKFNIDSSEIIIATTRPELLYSCQAILVHPKDERYMNFHDKEIEVPLFEFTVPIIPDASVDMEKGSGAVMCCTFGDIQDLEWFRTYGFKYKKSIESNGLINKNVPIIGGMHTLKARKTIIELLKETGAILKQEELEHQVAVHERCGNAIEILPSKQWYINILSEKDRFIDAAEEINWYPSHMKSRYLNWVENLKWNWCISRQRYFGVPFPIWYCESCGEIMLPSDEHLPINPLEEQPKTKCTCGSNSFIPEKDIMDTWMTSSVTPLINAKWKEADERSEILPMGLRTQAHEIIRTWTFYTIVKSIYHTDKVPWKDVMLSGFVLARKGEKMSKSKNNTTLAPKKLIDNHSADVIRYWAASAKLGTDTTFLEDDLKVSKRFITKLWNAAKFSNMFLKDYQLTEPSIVLPQDRWIISKSFETLGKMKNQLDNYEIGLARQTLDSFFWKDYCDNYLEFAKDRLYKPELHGKSECKSAQYAIYTSLLNIIKGYAIFTPFIAEELYHAIYKKDFNLKSIHLLIWEEADYELDSEFDEFIKLLLMEVRKYKSERGLSMKSEVEEIEILLPKHLFSMKEAFLLDIKHTTHAKNIRFIEDSTMRISIK